MQSKLFEYAVVFDPKPQRDAAGNDVTPKAEILIAPTVVLAKTETEVQILAARGIPATHLDKLDQVQVCIRPF